MRILSALPAGFRIGLAIAIAIGIVLGWVWSVYRVDVASLTWALAVGLPFLLAEILLITSLATAGGLTDILSRWPASETELGTQPKPLRDILMRLNGLWRVEQDKQVALQQRIAQLEAEIEQIRRADSAILDDMAELCSAMGKGILHQRVSGSASEAAGHRLAERFNQMAETLDDVVSELKTLFGRMAEGDLSSGIESNHGGDFAVIREAAMQAIDRLGNVIGTIVQAANSISSATVELNKEAKGLAQSAEAQSESLDRTAADAASLSEAARANEAAAKRASQKAGEARSAAESGVQVVNRSIEAMNEMAEMSQRISEITSLINEIAFQTNLLALNASVEAARAGEAGKGFAVVAQEVRALAQRSAKASKDIKGLIEESDRQVRFGAGLVKQTGGSLDEIVAAVDKVQDIVADIATASQQQSAGLDEINIAVAQLDEMTQRNGSLVEQTATLAQQLADQAEELSKVVAFFRLDALAASEQTLPEQAALQSPVPQSPVPSPAQ